MIIMGIIIQIIKTKGKKNSIDSSVNKKKQINEVKVVRENNRNIDVNA